MADDLYQILGVERGATPEQVRAAYLKLARTYHPDVNQGAPQAAELFKAISHAYDVLSNAEKRELYDEFGEAALQRGFDPLKVRRVRDAAAKMVRPSDLSILGGRPRRRSPQPAPAPAAPASAPRPKTVEMPQASTPPASLDLVLPLELELGIALLGGEIRVAAPLGGGMLTVRVPAGVEPGARIRLLGKGHPHPHGRAGDLYLEVSIRKHPYFRREGLDLLLTLPVTVEEAVRGAAIVVPTPAGDVRLHVPANSSGGERLRVAGKGVRRQNGDDGDLLVELSVRLPKEVDPSALSRLRDDGQLLRGDLRL